MDDWTETELAWELADLASQLVPCAERIELYTAIGAGHSYGVIRAFIKAIERADIVVSAALATRLSDWFSAYTHHCDAPELRSTLQSMRSAG